MTQFQGGFSNLSDIRERARAASASARAQLAEFRKSRIPRYVDAPQAAAPPQAAPTQSSPDLDPLFAGLPEVGWEEEYQRRLMRFQAMGVEQDPNEPGVGLDDFWSGVKGYFGSANLLAGDALNKAASLTSTASRGMSMSHIGGAKAVGSVLNRAGVADFLAGQGAKAQNLGLALKRESTVAADDPNQPGYWERQARAVAPVVGGLAQGGVAAAAASPLGPKAMQKAFSLNMAAQVGSATYHQSLEEHLMDGKPYDEAQDLANHEGWFNSLGTYVLNLPVAGIMFPAGSKASKLVQSLTRAKGSAVAKRGIDMSVAGFAEVLQETGEEVWDAAVKTLVREDGQFLERVKSIDPREYGLLSFLAGSAFRGVASAVDPTQRLDFDADQFTRAMNLAGPEGIEVLSRLSELADPTRTQVESILRDAGFTQFKLNKPDRIDLVNAARVRLRKWQADRSIDEASEKFVAAAEKLDIQERALSLQEERMQALREGRAAARVGRLDERATHDPGMRTNAIEETGQQLDAELTRVEERLRDRLDMDLEPDQVSEVLADIDVTSVRSDPTLSNINALQARIQDVLIGTEGDPAGLDQDLDAPEGPLDRITNARTETDITGRQTLLPPAGTGGPTMPVEGVGGPPVFQGGPQNLDPNRIQGAAVQPNLIEDTELDEIDASLEMAPAKALAHKRMEAEIVDLNRGSLLDWRGKTLAEIQAEIKERGLRFGMSTQEANKYANAYARRIKWVRDKYLAELKRAKQAAAINKAERNEIDAQIKELEATIAGSEAKAEQLRGEEAEQAARRKSAEADKDIADRIDLLDTNTSKFRRWVRSLLIRELSAHAGAGQGVLELVSRFRGEMQARNTELIQVANDFKAAAQKHWGKSITDEQAEAVNKVLRGDADPSTLPFAVRGEVTRMRNIVDGLSREMIRLNLIPENMIATVEKNLGSYLTRSYRIFNEKGKWVKKLDPAIVRRAKHWIKGEMPGATKQELDQAFSSLINIWQVGSGPLSTIGKSQSKVATTMSRILTERKDIPKVIRELWGENTDPIVNFASSLAQMATMIESRKMVQQLHQDFRGVLFHDEPPADGREYTAIRLEGAESNFNFFKQADGEATLETGTTDVVYVDKDTLSGMKHLGLLDSGARGDSLFTANSTAGAMWRFYMKAMTSVKIGKTALSPMTTIRNFTSNIGFMIAMGHLPLGKGSLRSLDATIKRAFAGKTSKQVAEEVQEGQRLGYLSNQANAGELLSHIRRSSGKTDADMVEWYSGELNDKTKLEQLANVKGTGMRAVRKATDIYGSMDDFWKMLAFHKEYERIQKAKAGKWNDDQMKKWAAGRVIRLMPNYSNVGQLARQASRFPVSGTFTSFVSEVYRIGFHDLPRIILEEAADPDLRGISNQRILGVATNALIPLSISMASRALMGLDDEDEAAIRNFDAEWNENARWLYFGRDADGNVIRLNMSHTDPWAIIKKPALAALRQIKGREVNQGVFSELFGAYTDTDILWGAVRATMTGRTSGGGEVYEDDDTALTKFKRGALEFLKQTQPGITQQSINIHKGHVGDVELWGQARSSVREAIAMATGLKFEDFNPQMSLKFQAGKLRSNYQKSHRKVIQLLNDPSPNVRDGEIEDAYREMENKRRMRWESMLTRVKGARALGMTDKDIVVTLDKGGGYPKNLIRSLLNEQYVPWKPTTRVLESAIGKTDLERSISGGRSATREDKVHRYQVIRSMAVEEFKKYRE